MNDPQALIEKFDSTVSFQIHRAVYKAIHIAYSSSDDLARGSLDPRMVHQAWGYYRWLKVDSELLAVGERFGRVAVFESNTEQTHMGHAELHFGKFVLTAASVPKRGQRPKGAKYRELLANSNQEVFKFFEQHSKRIEKSGKIWAVILHVPNVVAKKPLHIDIAFFAKDMSLAAPLINVMKRVENPTCEESLKLRRLHGEEAA